MSDQHPGDPSDPTDPSDPGGLLGLGVTSQEPGRRKARTGSRRLPGCLAVLVALAVIGGLVYVIGTRGAGALRDALAGPEDYPGPGSGQVQFEVRTGDTASDIGRSLKADGVVASVDAFVDAAKQDSRSSGIQVGFYQLKKQMKASAALAILVDPANVVTSAVAIPEGLRVSAILDILAKKTDFSVKDFEKVLDDPSSIGLPSYANGSAEGYLFPATYSFAPDEKPVDMLTDMVDRWRQAAEDDGLVAGAQKLGYTPGQIMTIASLVESEGRGDDMPKIARVIYNRLENPTAETAGFLGIDATVAYALGRNPGVALTAQDLQVDSPYNTRTHKGLPPGPIESPGDEAIQAALAPAKGDWLYYVTVNLRTGETKFASNDAEFQQYKAEYLRYCQTSDAC